MAPRSWLLLGLFSWGCGASPPSVAAEAPNDMLEEMSGPYATVDAYCADLSRDDPSWRCVTESELVEGPTRVAGSGAIRGARIVGRSDGEGFTECALAVETAQGWFVGKTAPICRNVGTSRTWLEVEALEAGGEAASVRWVEVDSYAFDANEGWVLEQSRRSEHVACVLLADGVPACSFRVL